MEEFKFWSMLLGETESPVLLIVLAVMGVGLTLSKKAAEIQGPLGAAARWWRDRKIRRIREAQRVWRAQLTADEEQKDARIADLKEQVEYLKRELSGVRLRAIANGELLQNIDRKVGTVNAKLSHPSILPRPREVGDTEPMKRVHEPVFVD
jgi:hypothetical protein